MTQRNLWLRPKSRSRASRRREFEPDFFLNLHHASPERGVCDGKRGHAANGGFLCRRREREVATAHLQDEFRRDRGVALAAEGMFYNLVSLPSFTGLSRGRNRVSLSAMSATLTVKLDADVLQSAEQEARARHTTLPEVVAHQLQVMARNWQASRAGRTTVTDALRGAVMLPPDFDTRAALTEELQKKHGR